MLYNTCGGRLLSMYWDEKSNPAPNILTFLQMVTLEKKSQLNYRLILFCCLIGCHIELNKSKIRRFIQLVLFSLYNLAHICYAIIWILKIALFLWASPIWATDGADGKSRLHCFPSIVVCGYIEQTYLILQRNLHLRNRSLFNISPFCSHIYKISAKYLQDIL